MGDQYPTRVYGLYFSITDSHVKNIYNVMALQADEKHEVAVLFNGEERTFTLFEFLTALGFATKIGDADMLDGVHAEGTLTR